MSPDFTTKNASGYGVSKVAKRLFLAVQWDKCQISKPNRYA